MKTAGGIVAIIAGVFGVGAAFVTLLVGGLGSAMSSTGAGTVVALGWGGVFFAFAVIVLGAVCIAAKSRVPGYLLMASAVFGAILGGTLVAVFMVLALVGGILATIGVKKPKPEVIVAPGAAPVAVVAENPGTDSI